MSDFDSSDVEDGSEQFGELFNEDSIELHDLLTN